MSMIKQNHSNQFAAVTLFVVLMGCGMAQAKEKPHYKGRVSNVIDVSHKKHFEQKLNARVKDKKAKLSKPSKYKGHPVKGKVNPIGYRAVGTASWYGYESGNITAMGTRFNPLGLSAAHRTLPLPTKVRITNLKNKKSIIVTVTDRGPYASDHGRRRLIDLSLGAARKLDIKGLEKVEVVALR